MKTAVAALVSATILGLTGCGTGVSAPSPAVNASDVMFLQMMVSQERQTAAVIRLVRGRSVSAATRDLTAAIAATQADEVDAMVTWLRERDQPAKADPEPETHTAHGGLTSVTATDLAELRRARGHDFERRILNVLLGQQHNAIELARTSTATAGDPWVKELARRVDRSRTAEVAQMLTMVAALPTG
jgi:uncharacterized protein (DUF305 family)